MATTVTKIKMRDEHQPVLLDSVVELLAPQVGQSYLDLTAGRGGHAAAIQAITGSDGPLTLVDRDAQAIQALQRRFRGSDVLRSDFLSASRQLAQAGKQFDMILADIGVSSPHFNEGSRGFSLQLTGPLDMRMDQRQALTAAEIVNDWSTDQLSDMLRRYGEEPKAKQIARLIVKHRPLESTTQLAEVVAQAWPGHSRLHPATRTFQALRIAVNDELGQLEASLPLWLDLLAPGGRLAVISFHSLEDRIVKNFLAAHGGHRYDADLRLLTRRPLTATPEEIVFNPRARSAKLRAAVKIKNQNNREEG